MQILGCMQKKLFRIVDNFIAQNWHRFIISHSGILQNFQLFKYIKYISEKGMYRYTQKYVFY